MKFYTDIVFLFLFIFLHVSSVTQADPMECVSEEEAGKYVGFLGESGYLLEDCYYCEPAVYRLIRIDDVYTKDCHWNDTDEDFSTAIYAKGEVIYSFEKEDFCHPIGKGKAVSTPFDDLIILNYVYGMNTLSGSVVLSSLFSKNLWSSCLNMDFPSIHRIANQPYKKWYKEAVLPYSDGDFYHLGGENAPVIKESSLPIGISFEGSFQAGISFEDRNGTNYFFFSQKNFSRENRSDLFVYQYTVQNDQAKLVWDIKEFGSALCSVKMNDFSLQIIDLDADGLMETSFIYHISCDGLDPEVTKLMLHTKGNKLAIRGSFDVADKGQELTRNFDAAFNDVAPIFKHFAERQWQEYLIEHEWSWPEILVRTKNYLIFSHEIGTASGGMKYLVCDKNGAALPFNKETKENITYSDDFEFYPTENQLLYLNSKQMSIVDLKTLQSKNLVQFFDDNEAVSSFSWSPDKTKIAFVTLNYKQYKEGTKIFVLTLDDKGNVTNKQKYDIRVEHMAASNWVISPVTFIDNHTLKYFTRGFDEAESKENMLNLEN